MLELGGVPLRFVLGLAVADMFKSPTAGAVGLAMSIFFFRFAMLMNEHQDAMASNNSVSISFSLFVAVFIDALVVVFCALPLFGWLDGRQGKPRLRAFGIFFGLLLLLGAGYGLPLLEHYIMIEWLNERNVG